MKNTTGSEPKVFGLFEKRIEGDDALLDLASHRFGEAGLGMECYAGSAEDIGRYRALRYSEDTPMVFHLPRWIDLMNGDHERFVKDFLVKAAGIAYGAVVHDQRALVDSPEEYRRVLERLGRFVTSRRDSPLLFIEYATKIEPGRFASFFTDPAELPGVSACIDTGHLGSKVTEDLFLRCKGGAADGLTASDPSLPECLDSIDRAVQGALPCVREMAEALAGTRRPLHFHLHDGHPLSTGSPYGVPDHLSFFDEVPIPFEHRGRRSLPPMFGPSGLDRIVSAALSACDRELVSFSLEIHPSGGRSPLGDYARFFTHWSDMSHAEQMNHWLSELIRNYHLLTAIIERSRHEPSGKEDR